MDPLSALSVASAVVTFVDFGSKLLSHSRQVYKRATGETREEASLSEIADDLKIFGETIQNELSALRRSQQASTAEEDALAQICQECIEAHKELNAATKKLQTISNGNLERLNFKHELDTAANQFARALQELKFDIILWKGRLDSLRKRLTTAILAVLWLVFQLAAAGLL